MNNSLTDFFRQMKIADPAGYNKLLGSLSKPMKSDVGQIKLSDESYVKCMNLLTAIDLQVQDAKIELRECKLRSEMDIEEMLADITKRYKEGK